MANCESNCWAKTENDSNRSLRNREIFRIEYVFPKKLVERFPLSISS